MKLKHKDIKATREAMHAAQGHRCAVCGLDCTSEEAVLDHSHAHGGIRGVLHRGCNSLLGKLENNAPRYGVTQEQLNGFLMGAAQYLADNKELKHALHPTFKTAEEKQEARRARAKRRRAAKQLKH